MTARLSADGTILHIHIPMCLRRRGGRKGIITPDGASPRPGSASPVTDDSLVQAFQGQTLADHAGVRGGRHHPGSGREGGG
jgi:hypothetical protein